VAGEEREGGTGLEARRGSSELADERTLRVEACEAQRQTVPIGKRTAHQVPWKVVPAEDRYKGNRPFLL